MESRERLTTLILKRLTLCTRVETRELSDKGQTALPGIPEAGRPLQGTLRTRRGCAARERCPEGQTFLGKRERTEDGTRRRRGLATRRPWGNRVQAPPVAVRIPHGRRTVERGSRFHGYKGLTLWGRQALRLAMIVKRGATGDYVSGFARAATRPPRLPSLCMRSRVRETSSHGR